MRAPDGAVGIACEQRGEVEAEAVDTQTSRPVADRLDDEPPHGAVAGPGDDAAMKVEVVEQTSMRDWLVGVILPALTPVAIFGLIFVLAVLALLERGW